MRSNRTPYAGATKRRFGRAMGRLVLVALLGVLVAPSDARAHTTVSTTSPRAGDTLAAGPAELRILFNGRVESAMTVLSLTRDGRLLGTGGSVVEGSGEREYLLRMPSAVGPGTYVVLWRTVGADGHALQGEWTFHVAGDPGAAEPVAGTIAVTPPPVPPPAAPVAEPIAVAVRWLWFISLFGIVGTVAFRFGVLPPLERAGVHGAVPRRAEAAVWFIALAAAALSALTLMGRLWIQAVSLGGGSAWDGDRLRLLLTATSWGLAWTLQAIATVAFAVGLLIVRAPHGRGAGWMGAAGAAVLLATVPALSGHATGAEGRVPVAIVADVLHVLGGGVWMGTLAAVLAVGIPAALTGPTPGASVAAMVRAFSPLALVGSATVAATGVASTLVHVHAPQQLWGTTYGRALLLKLALVLVVAGMGWWHWRRTGPALGTDAAVRPLRRSVATELAIGALVLLVTALLVALPTPD